MAKKTEPTTGQIVESTVDKSVELAAAIKSNEMLAADLDTANSTIEELRENFNKLHSMHEDLRSVANGFQAEADENRKKIKNLEKQLEETKASVELVSSSGGVADNTAVVGGVVYNVVHVDTLKWVNEQYLKRYHPEDAVTLIVTRKE